MPRTKNNLARTAARNAQARLVFCSALQTAQRTQVMAMAPQQPNNRSVGEKTFYQRLGQSFNAGGIASFAHIALADRSRALPHLAVADLRTVHWTALRQAGFEGCVFDKDNTLTEPYRLDLHPNAVHALAECNHVFGGRVALYSNSAGLEQFDPDGEEAKALESALGIPVLRHKQKKPAGGPEDLERHFGCEVHKLIMIGDRYATDVAFGNRLGMLTIRPKPFALAGEPLAVRAARVLEEAFVGRCLRSGVAPPPHALVPDAVQLREFVQLVTSPQVAQ